MTPNDSPWMPSRDLPPFSLQGLLLALGLVAAIGLLVAFVEVLQQNAERGARLRAAQLAHRAALAAHDPREPRPAPVHLTLASADSINTAPELERP